MLKVNNLHFRYGSIPVLKGASLELKQGEVSGILMQGGKVVGELGKEILKGSDYGKTACRNTENAEEELGDCLFSLLALACEMNIDARWNCGV